MEKRRRAIEKAALAVDEASADESTFHEEASEFRYLNSTADDNSSSSDDSVQHHRPWKLRSVGKAALPLILTGRGAETSGSSATSNLKDQQLDSHGFAGGESRNRLRKQGHYDRRDGKKELRRDQPEGDESASTEVIPGPYPSLPGSPRKGVSDHDAARVAVLRTPESTPPTSKPISLVSPTKKMARIPRTPHHSGADAFWSQEFVDDWNMQHSSPRKPFRHEPKVSPLKASPTKCLASVREAKKSFSEAKTKIAEEFLQDLDNAITSGKLGELTLSTGGIRITWSNKLNTTAGRATWRRETRQTGTVAGSDDAVCYRHHASIELAEKVIDDDHRLLNVVAHEFCHLANFMVSGVTGNPHGREFKAWAAKCSRHFGHRGIVVTTKHAFDIDFKYVWECITCGTEFKRHSKSINLEKHRCGSCRGELRQTKPKPRVPRERSEYQKFVQEQMKIVKRNNPGSPQKDIMRLVADKWSKKDLPRMPEAIADAPDSVDRIANELANLEV